MQATAANRNPGIRNFSPDLNDGVDAPASATVTASGGAKPLDLTAGEPMVIHTQRAPLHAHSGAGPTLSSALKGALAAALLYTADAATAPDACNAPGERNGRALGDVHSIGALAADLRRAGALDFFTGYRRQNDISPKLEGEITHALSEVGPYTAYYQSNNIREHELYAKLLEQRDPLAIDTFERHELGFPDRSHTAWNEGTAKFEKALQSGKVHIKPLYFGNLSNPSLGQFLGETEFMKARMQVNHLVCRATGNGHELQCPEGLDTPIQGEIDPRLHMNSFPEIWNFLDEAERGNRASVLIAPAAQFAPDSITTRFAKAMHWANRVEPIRDVQMSTVALVSLVAEMCALLVRGGDVIAALPLRSAIAASIWVGEQDDGAHVAPDRERFELALADRGFTVMRVEKDGEDLSIIASRRLAPVLAQFSASNPQSTSFHTGSPVI